MRINRYLALCGFGSRRAVEELIRNGEVTVDGNVVTDLASRIEEGQKVKVQGKAAVPPEDHIYIMLNKPAGYLCSSSDPYGRPIIYDLLPAEFKKLHYVGRLDSPSRGLLILTTDGEMTHRLLHPSMGVPRTYRVWTKKALKPAELEALLEGVDIGFGETATAVSVKAEGDYIELVLTEGKNREIRRMLEVLGHKVVDLQRVRFGDLGLGDLAEPGYRRLKAPEVAKLHGKKT